MADDPVVELQCALVLGDSRRLGLEAGNDVVAVFLGADGVGEVAPATMVDLERPGDPEQLVKAVDFFCDGGVFERGVENVDRLVWTWHVRAILPLDVTAPRWLPKREEGNVGAARARRSDLVGQLSKICEGGAQVKACRAVGHWAHLIGTAGGSIAPAR